MVYRNKGFTLIELMVTLAVVAIVAAIALPSFRDQIRNNRSVSIANDFVDTVSFARAQAVSRPARVSICASNDGATCVGDWAEGYIVFVDNVADDVAVAPDVGEVLKVWQPTGGEIEMAVEFGANAANFIRFTTLGTLARVSQDPLTIQTRITGCRGNHARAIGVTLAGQTTVSPQDCDIAF